jgi:hypothetical protein
MKNKETEINELKEELIACRSALISTVKGYFNHPVDSETEAPKTDEYLQDIFGGNSEACNYLVKYGLASWTDANKCAFRMNDNIEKKVTEINELKERLSACEHALIAMVEEYLNCDVGEVPDESIKELYICCSVGADNEAGQYLLKYGLARLIEPDVYTIGLTKDY